ncbi:MAG TPA: diaminopimelate epimerase, partial [Tissierella sp.]|nr:diaminopimelate epimerase [Tissierella sp.]
GSCASVVIGNLLHKLNRKVYVNTEGGNLVVELKDDYKIFMLGSATHIARGEIY